MAERNRVTPFGTIEALDQRGLFLGNRGSIHGDGHTIRRRWCARCRPADHVRGLDAWEAAHGERPTVDPMDRRLHAERTAGEPHRRLWRELPDSSYVVVDGTAMVVAGDDLWAWAPSLRDAYEERRVRPTRGDAAVLTPPSTVAVLVAVLAAVRREAAAS